MRLALLGDLHGNYTATLALEKALNRYWANKIFCLGDVVGKGPNSDKTMDWALANCDIIIGGNWDYGIGHKRYEADQFYFDQLGEKRLAKLRELTPEYHTIINNIRLRLLHGRPVMDSLLKGNAPNADFEALLKFQYPTSNSEDGILTREFDVVAYADTHRQLLRTVNHGHIVNCGSVGNALGVGRACFAIMDIYDDGAYDICFCSIPYDRKQAVLEAENSLGLPNKDIYIYEIESACYGRKGLKSKAVKDCKLKIPFII